MAGESVSETPATQTVPKPKGKSTKVIALVLLLVVVIVLALILLLYGGDLFGDFGESLIPEDVGIGTTDQQTNVATPLVTVGKPESTPTLSKDDIDTQVIEDELISPDEIGYVFCEQLKTGDKVTTNGDPDKYDILGPVWFVYVDEQPNAWFEHDVKYVFIDAQTGEKTEYKESWPPDINGEDMFDTAEDCGGATTIYTT